MRPACRAVYGSRDLPAGAVDRDAYVLRVLEQLRAASPRHVRRAVAVAGRPAAMVLDGVAWLAVRTEILTGLGLAVTAGSTCGTWPARWMARGKEMAQRLAGAGAKASVQIVSAAQDRVQLSVGTPGTRSASRSH